MITMDLTTVMLIASACILVMIVPSIDTAAICYKCDHVAHPRDCDRVVQCADGEVCSVVRYEQADGNIYYHSGCMAAQACSLPSSTVGKKRDTAMCKECCTGQYCNKELCDVHSQSIHGPRCLQCSTVEDPIHCGAVTECNLGERCYTLEKNVFGERRYQLGCADAACVPRTSRAIHNQRETGCRGCCTGENCNRDLCNLNETISTTMSASTPVTTPSTLTGCLYKGTVYHKGASWDHGCQYQCTCLNDANGNYACRDLCPKYMDVPNECKMVKSDGECCPHPDCSGTNIHMTNFSTVNYTGYIGLYDCTYDGQHYKQNETWRDSCQWECTCIDSSRGYYKCHSLCYQWNLPTVCHMEPAAPGKCCQTPSCPLGYKINYPAGYVVN